MSGTSPTRAPDKMSAADALLALQTWLVQLRDPNNPAYTYIRRIELGFDAIRSDTKKTLRGVRMADNLVITRQLIFFQLIGRRKARAISLEEVAAQYDLDAMKLEYRRAADGWKRKKKAS